jgi:hypothetical protein
MRILTAFAVSALYMSCLSSVAMAGLPNDEKHRFATDTEIQLVITQAQRAMQDYEHVVDIEEQQFAKTSTPADLSVDRKLIKNWKSIYEPLKSKPQLFNGPLGLDLVMMLDDVSRNAALAAHAAVLEALKQTVARNLQLADLLLTVSEQATSSSALTYSVCENAGALYELYVGAMEDLAVSVTDVASECSKLLKHGREANTAKKP